MRSLFRKKQRGYMQLLLDSDVLRKMGEFVFRPNEHAFVLSFGVEDEETCVVRAVRDESEGGSSSVSTPSAPVTAHTHGIANYEEQDCFVGWPSGEDMRWVVAEAHKGAFLAHLCVALEGTYAVTANPRLRELPADVVDDACEDVYRYFSSRHGHRCGRGAEDERYPCALFFLELASGFSFGGGLCVQYAGDAARCTKRSEYADIAARVLGDEPVFGVRFLPHVLHTVDEGEVPFETLRNEPERHRRRIRSRAYTRISIPTAERYVRLSRKGCGWLTSSMLRRLPS
jgi:hypothetical protein